MGVEREYKFDVDPDWAVPDLAGPAGGRQDLPDEHLVSTYFDTADHRLWNAGMTLRHRAKDGGTAGKWTLKRPRPDDSGHSGASVRTELDVTGVRAEVPSKILTEVADVTGGDSLQELAVLESVRRRAELGAGTAWAELDDDSVTVTSGPKMGLRFRQLEVELLGDPAPGALEAVLSALAQAGAGPGGASKIGLAAGLEPPAN